MTRRQASPRLLAGVVIALLGLVVAYPIVRLGVVAAEDGVGMILETLSRSTVRTAVVHTLVLAVVVTAVAVPVGTGCALVLRRRDVPLRRLWAAGLLLPLIVPDFVLGYSWISAYAEGGLTDRLFGVVWPSFLGVTGVVVVLIVHAVPVAFLVVTVGLAARSEPDVERAASASGASAWAALRTVTLPLLRPAIAAASVLVLVTTIASFAVPLVIGARAGFNTVTTQIYANLNRASTPEAFIEAMTLALVLVVVTVVIVAPADVVLGPRIRSVRPAHAAATATFTLSRRTRLLLPTGISAYLIVAVVMPLLALVLLALTRAVGLPPVPVNWTLENFNRVLDPSTFAALGRSMALGVAAGTALVVLGSAVAVLERRRGTRWFGTLVTLTLVLPGSTLAVALLIAYGRWLGGSMALILLAYIGKLWALAHRPVAGALDRLPPAELRAARASGAGLVTAVRTVALRPLAPALIAAWLITFITAMQEVTMSSLLYGPGTETIAVVVLNSQELGVIGPTAALSVLLTVVVLLPVAAVWLARTTLQTTRTSPAVRPAPELTRAA